MTNSLNLDWRNWCRLCGSYESTIKVEYDLEIEEILKIFIGLPPVLKTCDECFKFLNEMTAFSTRSRNVDRMFGELVKAQSCLEIYDLNDIRTKYGFESIQFEETHKSEDIGLDSIIVFEPPSTSQLTVEEAADEPEEQIIVEEHSVIQNESESINPIKKKKRKVKTKPKPVEPIEDQEKVTTDSENDQQKDDKPKKGKGERSRSQCSVCGKMYAELSSHMKIHTGEKKYSCHLCEKSFTQSGHLTRHINSHLDIRKYQCDICLKKFVDPSSLPKHMVVHNKDNKKFTCRICGATFPRLASWKHHEQSHRAEKNYACDICHKRFAFKQYLQKHYVLHSGELKYKCPFCDKRFPTSKNINVHIRTHTKATPYSCDFCEAAFSYRSTLKSHMAKIHNSVPANKQQSQEPSNDSQPNETSDQISRDLLINF